MNQIDPVHAPLSYLLKVHFNIILHPFPGLPNGFLPLGLTKKPCVHCPVSICVMCPAHLILLDLIT